MKTDGEGGAAANDANTQPAYRVTLPEFEGPLDLLLHLCQTHQLDILNISIDFIAEKYIEYLELMQNMSVEVAADYLVMAAHLAYLKSRELVPTPDPVEAAEEGEEPLDPREELIRRLLEYQKYKHAAQNLGNRPIEGRNVFVRGAPVEATGEAGLAEHSVWKLLEHWAGVLDKAKPVYTHDVVVDRMSISDRINQLVDLLEAGSGTVQFEELIGRDLPPAELRHKVVVSLLAVLELARLRVVRILQEEATGAFFLARVAGAELADARNMTVTSAKPADGEAKSDAQTEAAAESEPASHAEAAAGAAAEADAAAAEAEADAAEAEADAATESEPRTAETTASEPETASETGATLAEIPADDPNRILPQEDVISALPPASTEGGEDPSDGQTKAEQEKTSE